MESKPQLHVSALMCGGGRKKADAEPAPEPSDYAERGDIPF